MNFADFDTLSHILFPVRSHLKGKLLQYILSVSDRGQVIICTRTRLKARSLVRQLVRDGFKAVSLERHPAALEPPVQDFIDGTADILVIHEAACREAPVRPVTHIVYHDMPYTPENYFRLPQLLVSEQGSCTIFSLVSAESSGAVASLEMALERDLERRTFSEFDYDAPVRHPVTADLGVSRGRRSGLRQASPNEHAPRGGTRHRGGSTASARDRGEDARKIVGSRSETIGGKRQQRGRPESRAGRNTGSSREWMEKESRHKGTVTGRKSAVEDSRQGVRRAKPSSQGEPGPRKTARRSIFGITPPLDRDEN